MNAERETPKQPPRHGPPPCKDPRTRAALTAAFQAIEKGEEDRAEAWLTDFFERTPELPLSDRSAIRYQLGKLVCSQGRTVEASELFEEALHYARTADDRNREAYALNGLAVVAHRFGELARADALWELACTMADESFDHRLVAMTSQNRGVLANTRSNYGLAMEQYRSSMEAFERTDDPQGVSWVANNLGLLLADLRRFTEAVGVLRVARDSAIEAKDHQLESLAEVNLAATLVEMDLPSSAIEPARRALELARRRGDHLREAEALKALGLIEARRGAADEGATLLERAHDLATAASDRLLCAEVLAALGEVRDSQGKSEEAQRHWESSESIFREIGALLDADAVRQRKEDRGESGLRTRSANGN